MTDIKFKILPALDHELSQEEVEMALESAELAKHGEEIAEVIRFAKEIAKPQTDTVLTHT